MKNFSDVFKELSAVNVTDKIEKKPTAGGKDLSYLSWTWAIDEISKRYPDFSYEVEFFDGLPYLFDEKTGYMVWTKVTIEGVTKRMWLPVMDSNNRALLSKPYEVSNKYGKVTTIQAATMFDINKTIMRCLVKNLAMFGLGLYIYAGEDLPDVDSVEADKIVSDTIIRSKAKEVKNNFPKPKQEVEENPF